MTEDGIEQKKPPGEKMQICGFLWVYYGYPASTYEGINVESVRNRCGATLARKDNVKVDMVAGIPDSGIGHGLGYASEAGIPLKDRSSSTLPPGRGVLCPMTRTSETWWPR